MQGTDTTVGSRRDALQYACSCAESAGVLHLDFLLQREPDAAAATCPGPTVLQKRSPQGAGA